MDASAPRLHPLEYILPPNLSWIQSYLTALAPHTATKHTLRLTHALRGIISVQHLSEPSAAVNNLSPRREGPANEVECMLLHCVTRRGWLAAACCSCTLGRRASLCRWLTEQQRRWDGAREEDQATGTHVLASRFHSASAPWWR